MHQMVDAGPGGGLAALVQPEARHHGGEIGTPDARQVTRLGGGRHDAGGGAHDVGEAPLHVDGAIAARRARQWCRCRRHGRRSARRRPGFPASGRARAPLLPSAPAPARCRARRWSRRCGHGPRRRARRGRCGGNSRRTTRLMGEIGPFAGDSADRALGGAGGAEGQEVGEVEEIAGAMEAGRLVLLQPEQLRRLHLRRDDAADIAQHVLFRLVDAPRRLVARWSIQTTTLGVGSPEGETVSGQP